MNLSTASSHGPSLEGLLLSGLQAAGVSTGAATGVVKRLLANGIDPDILDELNNLDIVIDGEEEKTTQKGTSPATGSDKPPVPERS